MRQKLKLTSFENTSLLRKFTILYFVMSVIPAGVLYYLYRQLLSYGRVVIDENTFRNTLIWVFIGIGVGYWAMRSMMNQLIEVTRQNTEALEGILGAERIKDISSGSNNEIAILARSFNEIIFRLEDNIRNLELAKKTLHSVLSRVGQGISSMENIDSFLNLIIETVTQSLQSEFGVLLLLDEGGNELYVKVNYGKNLDNASARIPVHGGIFAPVIQAKQPLIIQKIPRTGPLLSVFQAPMICAPLVLHDNVIGIMAVSGRLTEQGYQDDEVNLFHNLALQTAVAIENSRLNEDAERTYFETISALALAVEAKDPYSRGHSDRVAKFVVQIGKHLNLSPEDLHILRDAAKLHDLGKIGVIDKVLKKEGPLTEQEMAMMRKHCEIGEGIIKPIRSLRNLCDLVRHHHEKLNGNGYPDGLKGDDIHRLVRVLTVADIYDALTSTRSYRSAFTAEKAFEELRKMKDQVDQEIVEAFAAILKEHPAGSPQS